MPSHPERVRSAPLPEGYQFGDGRKPPAVVGRSGATFLFDDETTAAAFRSRIGLSAMTPPLSGPGSYIAHRDLGDEG